MVNLIQQRACCFVLFFYTVHSLGRVHLCVCVFKGISDLSPSWCCNWSPCSVAKSSSLSGLSGETCAVWRVRAVLTECVEMREGVLRRFKRHLF